jgi:hypothetical protein
MGNILHDWNLEDKKALILAKHLLMAALLQQLKELLKMLPEPI